MRPAKLLNLLANNAKRGEFRAEGNTIYLYDTIVASDADAAWFGGVSAESFVKTLAAMSGDVNLRINSPGGDVFAGVAMAQAIRAYPGKVTAHVDGLAASAASAVAVAADEAVMAPGSMLMIHNAWTIALGNRHDFMDTAALLEKIDGDLAKAYAKRAGGDAKEFAALMDAETWLSADETVELGLANSIAPEKTVENLAKFDLSAFEKAPAPQAGEAVDAILSEARIDALAEGAETLNVFGARLAEAAHGGLSFHASEPSAALQEAIADKIAASRADAEQDEIEHRNRQLTARLLQTAA